MKHIRRFLCWFLGCSAILEFFYREIGPAIRLRITQGTTNIIISGDFKMDITIHDSEQVAAHILDIQDAGGQPAQFQAGSVVFAVDVPSLITVTTAADGLSATFKATGTIGSTAYTVSGDADLGDGVQTIKQTGVIHVVAGNATQFRVAFDAPVPAAAAAPLPPAPLNTNVVNLEGTASVSSSAVAA